MVQDGPLTRKGAVDRRACLQALAFGAGALFARPTALAMPRAAFKADPRPLGLQLFTVRDPLQQDLESTLRSVADIGFKEVEMFGFGGNAFIRDPLFGRSAPEMRRLMDACGLTVPTAQISARLDDVAAVAATSAELGIQHLVVAMPAEFLEVTPSGPIVSGATGLDQIARIADEMNELGERCRSNGIGLGYHNHHMEFARFGGRVAYDVLMERTDPALVGIELDVGWVAAAGADPVEYLAKYSGRVIACHLKDFDAARALPPDVSRAPIPDMLRMSVPGEGRLDFRRVLAELQRTNVRHAYVECDLCEAPLEAARRAFSYLTALDAL